MSGFFWRYFQDTLAFGLIARPGAAAALAHGLARYLDAVRGDLLWVLDQFLPPLAEERHIPLHGDSRGVPRTRFDSDARHRTRVERAFRWHRLGGKEFGLPVILAEYGFQSAVVRNPRRENPDLWAHFDIDLIRPPRDFSEGDVDAVLALANQYKPGRSVIGKIQFATQRFAPLGLGAIAQTVVTTDSRVAASAPARPPGPAALRLGAGAHNYIFTEQRVRR